MHRLAAIPAACLFALLATLAVAQTNPTVPLPTRVSGRVDDSTGNPVSAVNVELYAEDGMLIGIGVTDTSGNFSIPLRNASPPFELNVNLAQQTVIATVTDNLSMVVLHVPVDLVPRRRGDGSASVSINDLEVPDKARAKLAQAGKAMAKSDQTRAMNLVNEALAEAPHWGRAFYMRAVLRMDAGDVTGARSDLAAALAADPLDAAAFVARAHIEVEAGQAAGAEQDLRRAINIPPVLWQAHYALAQLDLINANYAEALQMALRASTDQPAGPADCHLLAAQAADKLKDTDKAIIQYRAFLASPGHLPDEEAQQARQRLNELEGKKG